jgi:copper chaperone CopZ
MKSIKQILMAITLLLSVTVASAQIKNAKTETVKIYGNCGMCKTTIETAGSLKKVALVEWNKDTKMAKLTYDTSKTSKDEILKRVALVGYDSDEFLAPDDVYDALHDCCQYDREAKVAVPTKMKL